MEGRMPDEAQRRLLLELDTIFTNASLGILYSRDRVLQRCNPRAAEILGYAPDELIGQPGLCIYPDQAAYEALGRAAGPKLAAGEPFSTEMQLKRKDGSLVWCQVFAKPFDSHNTQSGTIWIFDDIELSRRNRQELEAIMGNAPFGIVFTRDRAIQRYNPKFAEMLHLGETSWIGEPTRIFFESEAAYAELSQRAFPLLSTGKSFQSEMIMRRKNDTLFTAEVVAYLVDPANPPQGTIWTVNDITARRLDQELLRSSVDRLESLMKNASVPILLTRDRMMQQHNAQFGRIFGFEGNAAIGKPARILFRSDEEYAGVGQVAGPLLSQAKPFRMELFMCRQDGNDLWINLIGFVADTQDTTQGTYWLLEDRTEFKQAEEALRQSHALLEQRVAERTSELEAANTRLQDFADTASDWFWEMGPDLRFSYFSERMTEILAIAPGANLGKTRQEVMNPADVDEKWERHFADLEQHRPFRNFEYRIKVPGGGVCEISVSGKPIFSEAGTFLGYRGIGQDISERKQAECALRESESRFLSLFEKSPMALSVTTEEDGFSATHWNQTWLTQFGYPAEIAQGKNGNEIGMWVDPMQRNHYVDTAMATGDVSNILAEMRCHDGTCRWVSVSGRFIDARGRRMLLTLYDDITERKQAEDQLRQAASVFEHANEGIIITDTAGTILDVNAAFTRITGFNRDEVLGGNPRILSSGRQGAEFYAAMWQALAETGRWSGEVWNRRKSGEVYAELLTISAIRDDAGRVSRYVALFSDITSLKEHQKQLEHIAHHDALTALPNRVLLADRLSQAVAQAMRRQTQVAVVYLDLDGFKEVNDLHGHGLGDRLLVDLAARMKQALREGDTLARLGGDEFVAVLLDLDSREASRPILDRMLTAASEPVCFDEVKLCVSASIGVSFYPQAEDIDADQLLRQADQAMYQAKRSGKNRYHLFDTEQDRALRGRHESLERIREGLERCEFVLFYQPKINLRNGEVIGAEALIRWQHPEQGLLPPAMFLPLVENDDLITLIGDWVIETALDQMTRWHAGGLDLPVSVNIAGRQLQSPDFLGKLETALQRHPTVAHQLELEVLESSALEDISEASQLIEACRERGVSFALDDFGTGYSSLTYLRRLPAQTLKIDQSFVRDMLEDPDDLAILDGIVGLAESFQRQAIAEGMETADHREMLLRLGCEMGQGYAIARPMPAAAMSEWVAHWHPEHLSKAPRRVNREDMPVLFAMTEHRAWIKTLARHLREKHVAPPPLDHHQCRFGRWLDKTGARRYATRPEMPQILQLHEAIHRMGSAAIERQEQGLTEALAASLREVETLSSQLLELLWQLIDKDSG
jgi:diguanylate cyclase (GGDEF)-like protein/PAS domain S-box-containing protein